MAINQDEGYYTKIIIRDTLSCLRQSPCQIYDAGGHYIYYAHARFDDIDLVLDASSQWLGRGENSVLHLFSKCSQVWLSFCMFKLSVSVHSK